MKKLFQSDWFYLLAYVFLVSVVIMILVVVGNKGLEKMSIDEVHTKDLAPLSGVKTSDEWKYNTAGSK